MTYLTKAWKSLRDAFQEFRDSPAYWRYPLSVRSRFQQVVSWWPDRDADFPLAKVNAAFARMQRDRAALAQGWRAGNFALLLLQALVARAVQTGVLTVDRVKQVPKLLPTRQPATNHCRRIESAGYRIAMSTDSSKYEKSRG
jgi:hypothetical protein